MQEIHVSAHIRRPLADVFEHVSDHERFLTTQQLRCRLVTEGANHRNGDGAVREISSGAGTFVEAISAFDPPRGFEYRITRVVGKGGIPLPMRHERGQVSLRVVSGGTRVDWYSRFTIAVPLLGRFGESLAATAGARAFRAVLAQAKSELERVNET